MVAIRPFVWGRPVADIWSHINEAISVDASVGDAKRIARAAAYVRMSTEHQRYSIANQKDIIEKYAAQHRMNVVRTYSDPGKSGLDLAGRKGLQRLLADVCQQTNVFDVILVQDISRWGRFQDTDEAAHYEHICRRAGYPVHYCAEPFENDGSPITSIMKNIKRVMAGEYSRELSEKTFNAQYKQARLGYRQSGMAGLGLRRMLVDKDGNLKHILNKGERKSLRSDKVVLVPGPPEEVQVINSIFKHFVQEKLSCSEIARRLNTRGEMTSTGGQWTSQTIKMALTDEKYIGTAVWNRTSRHLKRPRVKNPPDQWIRKEGAFEAIVDSCLFREAQTILRARKDKYSSKGMLKQLKDLLEKHGTLSGALIQADKSMPGREAYMKRFGSLIRAYELVGFKPSRRFRYLTRAERVVGLVCKAGEKIAAETERVGGRAYFDPKSRLIRLNDEVTVSLSVARNSESMTGIERWAIRLSHEKRPDICIGIRANSTYTWIRDYFVLPADYFPHFNIRFSDFTSLGLEAFRFTDLSFVKDLAGRSTIRQVVHESY